jgi:protein-S-isoprenylcysteine O-methyltransferase Ste14
VGDDQYNRAGGIARIVAVFTLLILLLSMARPRPLAFAAGLAPLVMGEAIRVWAAGYLEKTVELMTAGPYRYTRNPLYLGRLLIFSGLCVMSSLPYLANWVILALGLVVFFGYYLPRKETVEPARLRQVHGDAYERYFRSVPALFPATHPYADASPGNWARARMLRNREHWMVLGLAIASAWLWLQRLP